MARSPRLPDRGMTPTRAFAQRRERQSTIGGDSHAAPLIPDEILRNAVVKELEDDAGVLRTTSP